MSTETKENNRSLAENSWSPNVSLNRRRPDYTPRTLVAELWCSVFRICVQRAGPFSFGLEKASCRFGTFARKESAPAPVGPGA